MARRDNLGPNEQRVTLEEIRERRGSKFTLIENHFHNQPPFLTIIVLLILAVILMALTGEGADLGPIKDIIEIIGNPLQLLPFR